MPAGRRRRPVGVLVVSLVLGVATSAPAGPASDQLEVGIDKVIHVLADPSLKGTAKAKQRRDALREITGPLFDWNEMASRSLGRHWQPRTEVERQEFVRLFHDLLERSYLTTLERYNGERVAYGTESIEGEKATVRTQVFNKAGQQFPDRGREPRRELPRPVRPDHQDRLIREAGRKAEVAELTDRARSGSPSP